MAFDNFDFYSSLFKKEAGDYSDGTQIVAGTAQTSLDSPPYTPPAGEENARKRYKRAYVLLTTDFDDGETVAIMKFDSGDRIHAIYLSSDGGGTQGALDIGLHKENGDTIDDDIFVAAKDITTGAVDRDEIFVDNALDNLDRGKPLWMLANIGAGSYVVDPHEQWVLTFTGETADLDASNEILVEVEYTAAEG